MLPAGAGQGVLNIVKGCPQGPLGSVGPCPPPSSHWGAAGFSSAAFSSPERGAAEPTARLGREELTPNPTSERGEKKKEHHKPEINGSAARAEGGKRGRQRERRGSLGERRAWEPGEERTELAAGKGRQPSTQQR